MSETVKNRYKISIFQAAGVELEYMVVDRDTMDIKPVVDTFFKEVCGEYVGDAEWGDISLNNELALHVLEFKTTKPAKNIAGLPKSFLREIQHANRLLEKHNACLMPGAMHPWMDPNKEMRLWPHDSGEIYGTFNKIFNCKGHGWGNLQSAHLNLPFSNDEEFYKLHSAIRLVLPLIPTLAASSPLADGKRAPGKDYRLQVYQNNAKAIFSVTGHMIPEVCRSEDEYQKIILHRIYKDLEPYDPEGILRYEWSNARGAIARFSRGSIEIRLVDVQETPSMDCAILEVFVELLKQLVQERWASFPSYDELSCEQLKKILVSGMVDADDLIIEDCDFLKVFGISTRSACPVKELWRHILQDLPGLSASARKGVELILTEGTLATRLLKALPKTITKSTLKAVYKKLCDCLAQGTPFLPKGLG